MEKNNALNHSLNHPAYLTPTNRSKSFGKVKAKIKNTSFGCMPLTMLWRKFTFWWKEP